VYDGAADVVEDVILYRPVYVCAPRRAGSDMGNGHSPSVRGVDQTSPSPLAGSPSAAVRQPVSGVSPAGSVEHVNAQSSPSHARSLATTRTTKKIESTTTTTTVDGRSNEHHHQHHHHHHVPHQQHKEELQQVTRSSHDVMVHGSVSRDVDPTKSTTAATTTTSDRLSARDHVTLTERIDAAMSTNTAEVTSESLHQIDTTDQLKHITNTTISVADTVTVTERTSSSSVTSSSDCNSTKLASRDHCVQVVSAERDSTNVACQPTPTN